MASKFNIGDRVVAVKPIDGYEHLVGRYGTVVHIYEQSAWSIGVEFDDSFSGGHDCHGHCDGRKGRYGQVEDFELLVEQDISPDADEISILDNFLMQYQK